ncbi:MAG TPA: DNA/RNA non-specific endonuclease [Chryseosolibacter sp.]
MNSLVSFITNVHEFFVNNDRVMKRHLQHLRFLLCVALACCSKEYHNRDVASHDRQQESDWKETLELRTAGEHLIMGNPSDANASLNASENYLLLKKQFALSYHRTRGTPNWVSWHLDKSWIGTASRQDNFREDSSLPVEWERVTDDDYNNSGFDRGHHCPSGDRTFSINDNASTFLMSNIIPQAPANNRQLWADLEQYCRDLVDRDYELYIIMGSYGTGGTGTLGMMDVIAKGKVTVPERIWKTILILPKGENDLSRTSASTRLIAVDMPNTNNITGSWGDYRVSVNEIETVTGFNLYSALPSPVQSKIEALRDNGPTQ